MYPLFKIFNVVGVGNILSILMKNN